MPSASIRARIEDCSNLHIAANLERLAERDFHQSSTEYHNLREAARRLKRDRTKWGA